MSILGEFGLCAKSDYDALAAAADRQRIKAVLSQLEGSAPSLENNVCDGVAFTALFIYLGEKLGNGWKEDVTALRPHWAEATGDYTLEVFTAGTQRQVAAAGQISVPELATYFNDFFQDNYGEAATAAWNAFQNNLARVTPDTVLIFRLC